MRNKPISESTAFQMVDIETLDNKYSSAIIQIGACRVNIQTGEIFDKFLINVDGESCKEYGLTVGADTLAWWQTQDPVVIKSLFKDRKNVDVALKEFFDWVDPKEYISAWGSSFDMPILSNAFQKVLGQYEPWKYYRVVDARTIGMLVGGEPDRSQGHHNALADAVSQAEFIAKIFSNK